MRALLGTLLCLALVIGATPPVAGTPLPQSSADIDVVFMVDTSKEMETYDASQSRLDVIHAIIDLSRGLGTQRVAVVGLARNETELSGKRTLLPLTELPADLGAARAVIEGRLQPVVSGLRSDGDGLTIVDSFEALESDLGTRGQPAPPLWVVLLTNGDADPIGANGDENAVDARIRTRAPELSKARGARTPNRDDFKNAAKEVIVAELPAVLSRLGDTTLTLINVGALEADKRKVLEPLAAATNGNEVLDLTIDNVRDVALAAIGQAPFPARDGRLLTRALTGAETQRLRVYQGTKIARVLLSAAHADFDATLSAVNGSGTSYATSAGGAVRELWLTPAPAFGEYELAIANRGADLGLGARLEFELDLRGVVDQPAGGTQAVGSTLDLGFQLVDFQDQVVSDPHLLRGGRVDVAWTDPAGNPPAEAWALTGDEPLARTFSHAPEGVTDGSQRYGWTLEAALLPDGAGGFEWAMEPLSGSVGAELSMPKLAFSLVDSDGAVEFEPAGASGALAFSSDYVSFGATQTATLKLDVQLLGMSEVPIDVRFEPSADFSAAASTGKTAADVSLDGQAVGGGTTVSFTESTPGTVLIEITKSGFGPYQGDVGELVAIVSSGGVEHGRALVPITMGAHVGMMTLLAVLLLLALLALAFLAIKRMGRRRAWLALLDSLDDETVLYFEDDEPGGKRAAAS